MTHTAIDRRRFCGIAAAAAACPAAARSKKTFRFRWIVASCLYGRLPLEEILPELPRLGAEHIDIWPEKHGNQREQAGKMGAERFAALLAKHGVKLGIVTRYDLGPFRLQEEMAFARTLGGKILVCGGRGPRGLKGGKLKAAVAAFVEKLKPHIAAAAEHGVSIAIENHGNNLIETPDSMKWLAEFADSEHCGIALAPYHLPQDPAAIGRLIGDLGERLLHFYAWEHGMGCHEKRPKDEELMQLPGRGRLDFGLIVAALKRIGYAGWTSVFMHPVPRGIPILPTAREVTGEIARAQKHLESLLK